MSDPVADAEAELAKAEANLAAAEQAEQPQEQPNLAQKLADLVAPVKEDTNNGEGTAVASAAPSPASERSTEEILANAPPLVMPPGQHIIKQCSGCGLKLEDPLPGIRCPNCGTPLP